MIKSVVFYEGVTTQCLVDFIDDAKNMSDIGLVDEFKEICKYDDGTKIAYIFTKLGIFEREAIIKIQKVV